LGSRQGPPTQFAWLSKQRGCRKGRFGIDWKQERYKRAKRAKQKAEVREQKAERMEKPEAEGYRGARRGWGREFTTHAITYLIFC
jgi:hypothetical protein